MKDTLAPGGRWQHLAPLSGLVLAAVAACGGDEASTPPEAVVPPDPTAIIRSTKWGTNVKISFGEDHFVFESDGIPNHALQAEYVMPDKGTPCVLHPTPECSHIEPAAMAIKARPMRATITTKPEKVEKTTSVPFGPMGVMISGASVFNPFEGDQTTVAMNANFKLTNAQGQEVAFMDVCNAHPSPQPLLRYHYHGLPPCVTAQVDVENGPSHIIGYAFDGFPIYGDRDINGKPVAPESLDLCNGIESPTPEFPGGVYHYVLLEVPTVQSTIRCLHGRLDSTLPSFTW